MSDPLFMPFGIKLAIFGGTATALWSITGMPPAPWYVRFAYYAFMLSMVYVVVQAISALYPSIPPGANGVMGAFVPVVIINLLTWLSKAAKDPLGLIKAAFDVWRGKP